jgi:hypothetical protein
MSLGVFISVEAIASLKFKNYREIVNSFETATNISRRNSAINRYYNERSSTLPQNGKFEELDSTALGTITGLASIFCQQMVEKDSLLSVPSQRWAHQNIDFSRPPQESLTPEIRSQIVNSYAELFWIRGALPQELENLNLFIAEMSQNKSLIETLTLTCTIVGTSLESLVITF